MTSKTDDNDSTGLSLEDAKRADRRAEWERRHSDGDDYGILQESPTPHTTTAPSTEPADPPRPDHEARRQTRLAPEDFDATRLPKPLVECGCDECRDRVDPLADGYTGAFSDILDVGDYWASEDCPEPRSMTVERAREAYLRYQRSLYIAEDKTSLAEYTRSRYGQIHGAERDLLDRYEDPTSIFLSLRLSPIEHTDDGRERWIEPVRLDSRLHDGWERAADTMRYQLNSKGFDWEYLRVTAATESAATPHTHVNILVDDPDDDVTVDMARSMVDSYVTNTQGAYPEDHPVEAGKRDAAIVDHDPPKHQLSDDTYLDIYEIRNRELFQYTTAATAYMLQQQPHWVLGHVYDGTDDTHADSIPVQGAAIAWACPHEWTSWSGGFPVGNE